VEHEPWEPRRVSDVSVRDDLVRLAGVEVGERPDHILVSEGVRVRVGLPDRRS